MSLSKLAVKRLTKLADYMQSLPASSNKHFNMSKWFNHEGDHDHKLGEYIDRKALQRCGTTACALGWACTIPSFRRGGLKIEVGIDGGSWRPVTLASSFFNISEGDAAYLFFSLNVFGLTTPKQWAKVCRKFIRENA